MAAGLRAGRAPAAAARHLDLPGVPHPVGAHPAQGEVQEQRARLRVVDAEPGAVPRRLLRGLRAHPRNGIPYFPIFLLSGLLVVEPLLHGARPARPLGRRRTRASSSKVAFPREILPLASVGAALVHFFLQSVVLVLGARCVFQYNVDWSYLPLLVPSRCSRCSCSRGALGILLGARSTCTCATRSTCSSSRCSRGSG